MPVSRQDLILICDMFLQDEINRQEVEDFAWNHITDDEHEWDDEIIADTLFEWDNEDINFPINKVNMQLWKKRLLTGNDDLIDHNVWNVHIDQQKSVCKKHGSKWTPINKKLQVEVAGDLSDNLINGRRHRIDRKTSKGATGWLLWTGEYSKSKNSFKPITAEHLLQLKPQIIKYLGLDVGFRFLVDTDGFEDVSYDETLKQND